MIMMLIIVHSISFVLAASSTGTQASRQQTTLSQSEMPVGTHQGSPYSSGMMFNPFSFQTGIAAFDQLPPLIRGLVLQSIMGRVMGMTGASGTGTIGDPLSAIGSGVKSVAEGAYDVGSAVAAGTGTGLAYLGSGIASAGTGIASAAGSAWATISQGALAAGTMGSIMLPVAGAAAAGYLGYKAYKWYKGEPKQEPVHIPQSRTQDQYQYYPSDNYGHLSEQYQYQQANNDYGYPYQQQY
jgi:hypothetical protein